MLSSDYHRREKERIEDEMARVRSTYQRAIADHHASSGDARERAAARIRECESRLATLNGRLSRVIADFERALWNEKRR